MLTEAKLTDGQQGVRVHKADAFVKTTSLELIMRNRKSKTVHSDRERRADASEHQSNSHQCFICLTYI